MAEADLGDDFGGVDDIDPSLSEVTGRMCLLQCVARRWLDLAGSLWYAKDYGKGLAAWQSTAIQSRAAIVNALEEEAIKDERVESCSVSASIVGESLSIAGSISDADGPFAFTVLVSQLSSKVMLENASQ